MNIKDFKESIDYLVKAELTPFIWGHAGIGKSSIVKQYAESKGYHFFPFYLGTQSDIGDILGLADFVRDENGSAIATTFAVPKWLRDTIEYCNANPDSGAVIFLDEFNRARRDILNGMFSLALDKTFHTIKLPKNCHIIAAGNPPTEEYVTTDVDETALMARFVHIKLEPSVEEWLTFAKDSNINDNLVQFIRQQPELLEEKRSSFNLPIKVDRRAYSRLNRLFVLNTPEHLMEHLMPGIIGLERTVAYKQFLKNQDVPLLGSEILAGMKLDMVTKWSNPENTLGSLLSLTCENLIDSLKNMDEEKKELTTPEMENLVTFFKTIPKDVAFKTMEAAIALPVFMPMHKGGLENQYAVELLKVIKAARGVK